MREEFKYVTTAIDQHAQRDWGTAYRDFADASVLFSALAGLGVSAKGNGRMTKGRYHASMGTYTVDLETFVEVVALQCRPSTWGNKMTTYTRIRSIESFFEFNGVVAFPSLIHNQVWTTLSQWLDSEHKFLPDGHWAARVHGNTNMQVWVREMHQVVCNGGVEPEV